MQRNVANTFERDYKNILKDVLRNGVIENNRTGVKTLVVFDRHLKINMREGFPIITSRKAFFNTMVAEFLWLIGGGTNTGFLKENGVKIWDKWADEDGNLGPVYGYQLRNYNSTGLDQLFETINRLINDPLSRRHVMTMWNPLQIDEMRLPPCHHTIELVCIRGVLNLKVTMRSVDLFVGLPYDIGLYANMLKYIASVTGLVTGDLSFSLANVHIYEDHIDLVKEYIKETIRPLPTVTINIYPENGKLSVNDFQIFGYEHGPFMKPNVAV